MPLLAGLNTGIATTAPLLAPLVTLNLWTFVMEAWMYAERIPALTKYNVKIDPEMTKERMSKSVPAKVEWPAQNYNHLHEQPTFFVSVMLTLTYLGVTDDWTVYGAWAYVGLRIVHSIVHASANPIMLRFRLFGLSSITLLGLTVRAATLVF